MRRSLSITLSIATASLLAAGCSEIDEPESDPDSEQDPDTDPDPEPVTPEAGLVFVLGNAGEGNEVVMLRRGDDGSLTEIGSFPTGGYGSDGGLGSQAAVTLSDDGAYLFAVNAGSDEVSSFRIYDDHLGLVDVADTGGAQPISVTQRGDRLYVVNAADSGSVSGFALDEGRLTPIPGASRPLSSTVDPTAAAQIGLSPDKDLLVVTEKATNNVVTYQVAADGSLGEPVVNPSSGETPFGFAFTGEGAIIVSEAFGGAPGASAASSYQPDTGGNLSTVSGSVASGEAAACWIQLAGFGTFAYATNTASNTISGYTVDVDGALNLFPGGGVLASLGDGNAPIDMAVSADEEFLYVLAAASDTIYGFAIEDDGSLTRLPGDVAVPGAAVGLAAF